MKTTTADRELVRSWRQEVAEMIRELRAVGLATGLARGQVLDLAAARCGWRSIADFQRHCRRR